MLKHRDSHVDHGLTEGQLRYLLDRFADRDSFFIETITLPSELGTVPCGLYGPLVGDPAIREDEVSYTRRGERAWDSRLVDLPPRQQHEATVIAGSHEETCPTCGGAGRLAHGHGFGASVPCDGCKGGKIKHACVLYTAFGGPPSPQEPGDLRRQIERCEEERRARDIDPAGGAADPEERAKLDPLYAKILDLRKKRDESDAFWREHALAK